MAGEQRGGGFLWGAVLGGLTGFFLGSYLATEKGRETVSQLRQRAGELASDPELRDRAQGAFDAARGALGDAVKEGVSAARERRQQLAETVVPSRAPAPGPETATQLPPTEEGEDG